MNRNLIKLNLLHDESSEASRECHMSIDLYQNARTTMGELRDMMRETGISWNYIQQQIDRASHPLTGVEKALDSMDPYTTAPGNTLRDLPRNVW